MFIYLKILYIAGVLHKKITIEGSRLTIKYIIYTRLHIQDFKYRTTYKGL